HEPPSQGGSRPHRPDLMDRKRLLKNPLLWIVAVLLLYFAFSMIFDGDRGYTPVPTSQAVQQIESGNVTEANLEDKEQQLKLTLSEGINVDGENAKQIITKFPAGASGQLYNVLLDARTGDGDGA